MNNLIPKVAKMLGVEIDEEFTVTTLRWKYKFKDDGLYKLDVYTNSWEKSTVLSDIIEGKYEIIKAPFRPKDMEYYFTITSDKQVYEKMWHGFSYDYSAYMIGNCFRTEVEAEANKEKIIQKFRDAGF